MDFKMALIQMAVTGGDKRHNLLQAEKMIAEAARQGCKLAVLPEALDLGWTHPSSKTEAEPVPDGEPFCRLAKAASVNSIYICAGLTERCGDRVYNSAVIIGKDGRLLLKHRKINELVIGHPFYALGDRLNVVQTELGTLGLMICADGFARDLVLSRALSYMGADIILSPCAWAVPGDHDNLKEPYGDLWRDSYKPVAKDFSLWIAGVSNVGHIDAGPWAGHNCIGCSLVIGPNGEEIIQGPYGANAETILYVDVNLTKRPAQGCCWIDYWKAL